MILRVLTTIGLVGALAAIPAEQAEADAGDFIGGAIVGGLLGAAIQKDQQRKRNVQRQRTYTTKKKVYRPRIPVTQQGRQTQTALNYFGFNAGAVDGQIGRGTRRAIEAYQASMGYPINGRDFQPYQFDFLMQAYWWGQNGGQLRTGLAGQPLLAAYRGKLQQGTLLAAQPQQQVPGQITTVIVPAPAAPTPAPAAEAPVVEAATTEDTSGGQSLPNLFAGSAPVASLANRCNGVMLQTTTNGGYTTLASLNDGDFALTEQFCLARSYAIARGEELMSQISGLTPEQVSQQCGAYGDMLAAQADSLSLLGQGEAVAEMRKFALGTGISPQDLASTSRVCLSVGYAQDNMQMALGASLMLVALGEAAYGELLGHHLREGFGASQRPDLAMQWYDASLSAIEGGAKPVFVPGQSDRPQLLRAAVTSLSGVAKQGMVTAPAQNAATLPTFKVSE